MAATKGLNRQTKSQNGGINGTKLELTLAAERVFALNGLHGATFRQIREEAGQKNESVIHYYFGSRDAIIESILHLHSKPMDEARKALLEQARQKTNGGPLSAEQIARCCILPLAEYMLGDRTEPGYYMRFLVQLRGDRAAWRQFSGLHDQGVNECLMEMGRSMPYLPSSILAQRFVSVLYMHLSGMAAIEQIQTEKGAAFRKDEAWIRVEDMIHTAAMVYSTPLSTGTIAAIQNACEHQPMPTYLDLSLKREFQSGARPLSQQ